MARDRLRSRARRDERGQALIFTVLAMFVIFAFAAFAIDMAQLVVARHRAQLAADSGALAAASDFPNKTTSITTDANAYASANSPGGTATVSEPDGNTGTKVQVAVSQPVPLAFGSLFHLSQGTVSATAVAQLDANQQQVADGDISPAGCPAIASNPYNAFCEYYAGQTIGNGPWQTTTVPSYSSTDLQSCDGAVGGNCYDSNGQQINDYTVDLNGNSVGGMTQTVSTIAGQEYLISFDVTGNPAGYSCTYNLFTGNLEITSGSTTIASTSFSHTNPCANNIETPNFQSETLAFVATSSNTTITFNSTTYDFYSEPFVSASDGNCLDNSGSSTTAGTNIIQYKCGGSPNQNFKFVPVSGSCAGGESGTCYGELLIQNSGYDVAVSGGSKSQGVQDIVQEPVDGSTASLWQPVQQSDGSWSFKNDNSALCLDFYGSSQGAQLDQWPCKNGAGNNQDFNIAGDSTGGSFPSAAVCGNSSGNGNLPCDWFGPEVTGINLAYTTTKLIQ